jgi:predicted N-acetyltransferase YhbS
MLAGRLLNREDIPKIWTIDRRETIDGIYVLEGGELRLKPMFFEATDWPPGEPEKYAPLLQDCFDRGGWFYGLWDGETLAAEAVVDPRRIGEQGDLIQLKFLHVSYPYRGTGLGSRLFGMALARALEMGARGLYISANPTRNAVQFYLARGCTLCPHPVAELFALEPEDIHLECRPAF